MLSCDSDVKREDQWCRLLQIEIQTSPPQTSGVGVCSEVHHHLRPLASARALGPGPGSVGVTSLRDAAGRSRGMALLSAGYLEALAAPQNSGYPAVLRVAVTRAAGALLFASGAGAAEQPRVGTGCVKSEPIPVQDCC